MTDYIVKRLRDLNTHMDTFILDEAADRIEKLVAEEIDFDRVIGNYASENALFRDRIETLEAALRTVKEWHGYGLPPETTRIIDAALDAE